MAATTLARDLQILRLMRETYHLTLGELIETLEDADPHLPVHVMDVNSNQRVGLGSIHPHVRYQFDLRFEPELPFTDRVAVDLLIECRNALHMSYPLPLDGEFTPTPATPLWIADDLQDGLALLGCHINNSASLVVIHFKGIPTDNRGT